MASSGYESPWANPDDPPRNRQHQAQNGPHQPSSPESSQSETPPKHYGPRTCRFCFEEVQPTFDTEGADLPGFLGRGPSVTYQTEGLGRLFRPCLCSGTQKFVHEGCLEQWRYSSPNDTNYWQCPTCRYHYNITRMSWARWISSTGQCF